MNRDSVDMIIEQWRKEVPDLSTTAMAIFGRLQRINKHVGRSLGNNFSRFNLNSGEFDVLATLRRSGEPYMLKPTDLYNQLMVTSGAMTNRIDTLEKKSLVMRVNDVSDRRTVYVKLTEKGLKIINEAIYEHVNEEEKLLECLSKEDADMLNIILKKIVCKFEKE
ncbi:MarR family winged helix-turn-helix transcriptional regulator [Tepidibacter aestuarii]|uniref:MarR family winged helix-turn-helix transcriptional regulator n=1 Tax=Tepidibacter aestuarii TaxID=2925782 RepID=UPI0020BE3546|nr:MarR family transcriptional regulator [Tepidibacter aestuarii]CAH2215405.1 Transcriptional regulator, MarR family [Tepidibacter aestuarii]